MVWAGDQHLGRVGPKGYGVRIRAAWLRVPGSCSAPQVQMARWPLEATASPGLGAVGF